MKNLNSIQIENLDNSKTTEIIKTIQQLETTNFPGQEIKLMPRSLAGSLSNAMDVISNAHSAKNVDLVIEASGENGFASAIITAAGKPGSRVAGFGATFTLNESGPYAPGTTFSTLSSDHKVIYQTLSELTGRKKAILGFIVSGAKLSANDAKRCGIVDRIAQFRNKYSRKIASTETTSAIPVTPAPVASAPVAPIAPVVLEQQPLQSAANVLPNPKRRGRPKAATTVTPTATAVV
ncbi:MAG: ATP-dependent Clp protease proteolytic subunit [Ignavibacteria bacterium]|nr:ATP-dependent Clp protease proteolytic subunit [Ignavibacteria bacterium]